jgi:LysR family nitrogen assimilation transcriptional regulator
VDTRHLRSFLKVADTGSITRAAESLDMAQASLSQQILRLESELGFDLLRRSPRGVSLTEAGRVFQEHARQILRSTDQAVEDGRKFKSEPSGEVILAVPPAIAKVAAVPLVEAFVRHAPQLKVRLVEALTGQIRGWLDAGKVDLGVLHDLGPLRHLAARRLANEELFLVGPADRFGGLGEMSAVAVESLGELPMILPGLPHGLRQVIDLAASRAGAALDVRHEVDAMWVIGELVASGLGYAILPLPIVGDVLASGRVSVARIQGGAFQRTLCLVRNSGQLVTHASVRCEDLTVKVLARLIEKGVWRATPDPTLR